MTADLPDSVWSPPTVALLLLVRALAQATARTCHDLKFKPDTDDPAVAASQARPRRYSLDSGAAPARVSTLAIASSSPGSRVQSSASPRGT